MKAIKTIVSPSLSVIGFVMEGRKSEFGLLGTEKITQEMTVKALAGFRNSQMNISANGGIEEKPPFRINKLDMVTFNSAGQYSPIDNSIELKTRILIDGELKGFEVVIGGTEVKNLTYPDTLRATTIFNPKNFITKQTSSGTTFIAGKPGEKLEDLPERQLVGKEGTNKKKKIGSKPVDKAEVDKMTTGNIASSSSILKLYNIISEADGLVVFMKSEKYNSIHQAETKTSSEFLGLQVGEVGKPYIDYPEASLNANTTFKKAGIVNVAMNGVMTPLYTFTWSKKTILENGENHIKKFAMGVNKDTERVIIDTFGSKLLVKEITDSKFITAVQNLTGKHDLAFFEVDASKLVAMEADEIASKKLSCAEVYEQVSTIARCKAYNKVVKAAIKDIQQSFETPSITGANKPLFGMYSGMSEEALMSIQEAGIDPFTGAFVKKEAVEKKESGQSPVKVDIIKKEIEFTKAGTDIAKLSYAGVQEAIKGNVEQHKMCDGKLVEIISIMNSFKDYKQKLELLEGAKKATDTQLDMSRKKLWLHKISNFIEGNNTLVLDPTEWEEVKSRSKNGAAYKCLVAGCDGLTMKVAGVDVTFK